MIDRSALLSDLQPLVRRLEDDLRERCAEEPEQEARLKEEWQTAKDAGRTRDSFKVWRDGKGKLSGRLTEVAAAWVLATVFVRFLEDNRLIDQPRLSGPGDRRELAADVRSAYFREDPLHNDRDYLKHVFRELAELPALGDIFHRKSRNPLWTVGLSADGAKELIQFWQRRDEATGDVLHDFTTGGGEGDGSDGTGWDTRFLGDLYEDLSEAAKKRFALLQTPDFVEEFILDRTLEPACEEFGYREVRLIDPACGSGHFLLGAFGRLFRRWAADEPGTNPSELAQRVLDQVAGVDINPFAVAIARFRLILAAASAAGIRRLPDAPAFHPRVAAGDSLLHGPRPDRIGVRQLSLETRGADWTGTAHLYPTEDRAALTEILGRRYHAVVGNPPYITVKDKAQNAAIRDRYESCSGKYALSVPFMERLFDLAIAPEPGERSPAGFVGQITSNSFMKREFGKKLIREFVPRWDLTHVIDMSGAYVPGHGTPTVILIGRHRRPVGDEVRAVLGIRGEPSTPDDPAEGRVWTAIRQHVDRPGSESEFVSADDVPRERFQDHPWSLQGGGAVELLEALEATSDRRLGDLATHLGIASVTGEDDLYMLGGQRAAERLGIELTRPLITGDLVRDWSVSDASEAIWLYDDDFRLLPVEQFPKAHQLLWCARSRLSQRKRFGTPMLERGLTWYEWQELYADKLRTPLSITFAFVATHNHFVLDRGGRVFKQSAPVIKLPPEATEDDHLALLGLLNSSVACFWMKMVFYAKSSSSGDISTEKGRPEAERYEFAGTGMLNFPLPSTSRDDARALSIARLLDEAALARASVEPRRVVRTLAASAGMKSLRDALASAEEASDRHHRRMVMLQEELDWECYHLFGLTSLRSDVALIAAAEGGEGIEPEARPAFWVADTAPDGLAGATREVYRLRREETRRARSLRLVETAVYKRLWLGRQGVFGHGSRTYAERAQDALREWLLDRLESPAYWPETKLQSVARLAEHARGDVEFQEVAEVYTGTSAPDPVMLIEKLTRSEAVPFLAAHRYKPSGLRKRARWEETWEKQREEDRIDARTEVPTENPRHLTPAEAEALKAEEVGEIPVPPTYASGDFAKSSYWSLRGKLDVPKERFISYPGAEREADPTTVLGWAGWDHEQRTQALVAYYQERRERESWPDERFVPLLAGVWEQIDWLLQWHNDPGEYDEGAGDTYGAFVLQEARSLGIGTKDLEAWRPPKKGRGAKRKTR